MCHFVGLGMRKLIMAYLLLYREHCLNIAGDIASHLNSRNKLETTLLGVLLSCVFVCVLVCLRASVSSSCYSICDYFVIIHLSYEVVSGSEIAPWNKSINH